MELKFIDNPVRLQAFLNEPGNTENIVEPGHTYYIKPDAVYLGIYEGLVLAGVHEVRNFWHIRTLSQQKLPGGLAQQLPVTSYLPLRPCFITIGSVGKCKIMETC